MRLNNKVALVTGAAGGIGSAVARSFAREGCKLALGDLADLSGLAQELGGETKTLTARLDVTDHASVHAFVDAAVARFDRIDILANCAGVAAFGGAESISEADWDHVLDINLKGTFLPCQAVMRMMRAQRFGRIINIGSILGKNGGNARPWLDRSELERSGNVAYGASKAGVHAITTYLARDLASSGVTVNAIAPGPIASAMTTTFPDSLKALIPVGRLGRPEEVAAAAVFLASDEAAFITAEILDVNGGMWAD